MKRTLLAIRFLPASKPDSDRAFGADGPACAAPDALGRARMLDRVDIHHASFRAFAAADAFALVDCNVVEADFVEQSVDRAERAEDFTKEPSDEQAADDNDDQYAELYPEQHSSRFAQ